MPFIVVYDANVLYPNTLRDLLIRIGQSGLVQAKWTARILDEMTGNLSRNRPDIPHEKLAKLRELMNAAVRDCLVENDFLLDQIDFDAKVVWACIQQIVDSRKRPPTTIDDVIGQLERCGLVESTAALRIM